MFYDVRRNFESGLSYFSLAKMDTITGLSLILKCVLIVFIPTFILTHFVFSPSGIRYIIETSHTRTHAQACARAKIGVPL